jgi:DNA-binding GntR family transcriptional regulator
VAILKTQERGALESQGQNSAAERAADALRARITEGDLPPGTHLHEDHWVKLLDVSRNTLREAFRLLAHERLLVYRMNRGVAVRELDDADLRDIYRTREVLELAAIDYSVDASREQLLELLEIVERAEQSSSDDSKHLATLNIEFHQRLVELIGGVRINVFFRTLDAELRLVFSIFEAEDFYRYFIPGNRKIAELLLVGDRRGAKRALRAYLAEAELLLDRQNCLPELRPQYESRSRQLVGEVWMTPR